jgi:hypothetical protein
MSVKTDKNNQKSLFRMAKNHMETSTSVKKSLGVRSMASAIDVRKLLAKLIRAKLAGDADLDNDTFRTIISACGVFLRAAEQADTDDRLQAIEKQLEAYEQERSQ